METGDTREKILQAAIDEFTEYGYEGARMARIAKRAGVSQALIYYNFDSKQAILEEIIAGFLQANVDHIGNIYPPPSIDATGEQILDAGLHNSLDFILERRKEVSILLMQAILKTDENKQVLTIFNEINQKIRDITLKNLGYRLDQLDGPNRKVIDYFFIFMPFIMFGVLGEEWARENKVGMDEANAAMIEAVKNIYNCYIR